MLIILTGSEEAGKIRDFNPFVRRQCLADADDFFSFDAHDYLS
jgi:hypothetical protein